MKKRNNYTGVFKAKVALEAIKEEKTASEIASLYQIHPQQIAKWKKQALEGLPHLMSDKRLSTSSSVDEDLVNQLYQHIGQLKVELDWLKKKSALLS